MAQATSRLPAFVKPPVKIELTLAHGPLTNPPPSRHSAGMSNTNLSTLTWWRFSLRWRVRG